MASVSGSSKEICRSGKASFAVDALACASLASRRKKLASDENIDGRSGSNARTPRRPSGEALRERAASWFIASAATCDGISRSMPSSSSNWCVAVVAQPLKLPWRRMEPGATAGTSMPSCVARTVEPSSSARAPSSVPVASVEDSSPASALRLKSSKASNGDTTSDSAASSACALTPTLSTAATAAPSTSFSAMATCGWPFGASKGQGRRRGRRRGACKLP
mmetsp:Transcript_18208/g.52036  ORF Transcript_18208/g.52036 Transcript_18208/m.52036 type:complete len:221 (-) Transcript_18208:2-664(-)